MAIDEFLQFSFSGLTLGAIYGLVALGFNIVYNATGVVNFSQGELVMIAGMVAAWQVSIGLPLSFSLASGAVIGCLAGLGIGGLIFGPWRRGTDQFRLVMITLGLAITSSAIGLLLWGTDPLNLRPLILAEPFRIGGATLQWQVVWIILVAAIFFALLSQFYKRTRWGLAMIASFHDRLAAESLGVSIRRTTFISFALAGLAGSVAGILVTPITTVSYQSGLLMSVKGFTAAVLGGLGNVGGSLLGGYILGLVEAYGTGYISSGYKDAITLGTLVLLLLVFPRGVLGRHH